MSHPTPLRQRAARIALSHYVTVGLSAALGLLLITAAVHLALGAAAAAAASVGAIVAIPPDQPAPQRGKFWQLLPAALLGTPLFWAVQVLHASPLRLAALLVPVTFVAFLGAAWGKRGLPIVMSIMFAMIFSMAAVQNGDAQPALAASLHFALGAFAYVLYATLANAALNARYRVLMLADTLLSMAGLMRTQAEQFGTPQGTDQALIGRLLAQQAALTEQLQSARDMLLESPRRPRRQQLAGMLMRVLEMRDHLVACALDLDTLRADAGQQPLLEAQRDALAALAQHIEQIADALLLGRRPAPFAAAPPSGASALAPQMARALVERVGHVNDEVAQLHALARGETLTDLATVRAHWQLFVSPTAWSWQPFAGLWRWDAPPLRHAIRAALAIAAGQAIALALPWGTHDYWILLTTAVVLRGSLAQTLERRNSRVAGTLLGCLLAGLLLSAHAPLWLLLIVVTLAQGIAHAFAIRRYLVTAVAASVMALIQAHLLNAGVSPVFEAAERMADTLIGVALAWAFSYVLPSWERSQLAALVARTLAAQAAHARVALALGQLQAVDNESELGWRLARREAYDSLSALVQVAQRALSEPRAVRPPLGALERLLAHGYQLLAQLTAVKSMLLLRRGRLDAQVIAQPLDDAARAIDAALSGTSTPHADAALDDDDAASGPIDVVPELSPGDLSAWLLRRLRLSRAIAQRLRDDAAHVVTRT
jgi:uncharacterized membrane protein YccC